MSVSLQGRRAIVTGGAVGVGAAYVAALVTEGVHVATCDVREEVMDIPARLSAEGVDVIASVAEQ